MNFQPLTTIDHATFLKAKKNRVRDQVIKEAKVVSQTAPKIRVAKKQALWKFSTKHQEYLTTQRESVSGQKKVIERTEESDNEDKDYEDMGSNYSADFEEKEEEEEEEEEEKEEKDQLINDSNN